jgi:hypothetical protein
MNDTPESPSTIDSALESISSATQSRLAELQNQIMESSGLGQTFENIKTQLNRIIQQLGAMPLIGGLFSGINLFSTSENPTSPTSEPEPTAPVMSEEELESETSQNSFLDFLNTGQFSITSLIASARNFSRLPANEVNINLSRLQDQEVFPHNNGERCCAYYVSSILGLPASDTSTEGGFGSVNSNLIPYLIKRNLERLGSPGVILGFENMIQGDVITFKGTAEYAPDRYGHVAIVRENPFIYDGVKYMAIQHESSTIQIEFIAIDPVDADPSALQRAYEDPAIRSTIPQLVRAEEYRPNPEHIRFLPNSGYYGDATKGRGNAVFAVRTA